MRTTLLIIVLILISSTVFATTITRYSKSLASSVPTYTIPQFKQSILHNQDIIVSGKILKVSGNKLAKLVGTCSVVLNFYNIKRKGYKQNLGRVYIPSDALDSFKMSTGKNVIIQGVATSFNLSKNRINGERELYIEFDEYHIWLEGH